MEALLAWVHTAIGQFVITVLLLDLVNYVYNVVTPDNKYYTIIHWVLGSIRDWIIGQKNPPKA